jgi:hypothetical protein
MGLKLPAAPEGTEQIVSSAIRRAHSSRRFALTEATGGAAVVTPVAPHKVFTIGLTQVAAGKGIAAAEESGWRTIILEGRNPVAAVEFAGGGGGAAGAFKSLNQGPLVQSTASVMAMAEGLPQVQANDFEPRLLEIPAIYLVAIWLHGKEELFVPLEPAPDKFKPYQTYSEKDFFDLARILAKRRTEFDDTPKGEPPAPIRHEPPEEGSSPAALGAVE